MKLLLSLMPILFIMGCNVQEPTQVPESNFPNAARKNYEEPITTVCHISKNDLLHKEISCNFVNGSYSVAAVCVSVSFLTRFDNELVVATRPICPGAITPRASVTMSVSVDSRILSHACGRSLDNCYIRVDQVNEKRISP